jgi:Flp pilus assembly secretin CpaC
MMRSDFASLLRRLAAGAVVAFAAMVCPATAAETIDVTIDFAKIIELDSPAKTVFVGNSGIADATIPQNDRTRVLLTGKTAGTTNIIVLDDDGEEILNTTIQVASDIRQLTTVFRGASRQTFSCAPVCEQVISVGDDQQLFDNANNQITQRKTFLLGQ